MEKTKTRQEVRKEQTQELREAAKNNIVKRFRSGAIILTIFENVVPGKYGDKIIHNLSLQKSYKEGETWKYANSFSEQDIIKVNTLIDKASEFIFIKNEEEEAQEGGELF